MDTGREERKLVTVLFVDVVGSTRLAGAVDAERLREQMARFFSICQQEIEGLGGTVEKFIGDAVVAIFGLPAVHEEDAVRAVQAALAIRRRTRADVTMGELPEIRLGIATGEIVADPGATAKGEFLVTGEAVNLAARLQQHAAPGQIVVSAATHDNSEWAFNYRRLAPFTVKGKAEKLVAYECMDAASPRGARGPVRGIGSTLVGRAPDLQLLVDRIAALAGGRGGIVLLLGDAGLGKSRLLAEVQRGMPGQDVRWLAGHAISFGQSMSYWPFWEVVRSLAEISEDDREDAAWAKLERRLGELFGNEANEYLPYIGALLALPPPEALAPRIQYLDAESLGRQVFRAMRKLFDALARQRPLVLILEDWHWADQSSAELLEHIVPLVEQVPLLVICAARPDSETPATRLQALAVQAHAGRRTEMRLRQLAPSDSAALLQNLVGPAHLPASVASAVLQKAEGNPFFIEEVVRAFIDMKVIVRDEAAGTWRVARQIEDLTIPDTLRGVIMARIDRLEEQLKDVLKIAAVIGRAFLDRILRAVVVAQNQLDGTLAELQKLELITERRRSPELEYIFKHALTQEAAYESILVRRRRALHRSVATMVEEAFAGRLDEFCGLLAYHYARAEEWEKAQYYLFRAGDQAARLAADAEAVAHYQRALAAYAHAFGERWEPLQRAALERKMGEALFRRGEHERALDVLKRALLLLGRPYPSTRWRLRLAIMAALLRQLAHRCAPALLLPGVRTRTDPTHEELSRIYEALGWIDFFLDRERVVFDAFNLVNCAERGAYPLGAVKGYFGMGIIAELLGMFTLGRGYFERSLKLAGQVGNPVATGYAHLGIGYHEHVTGQWQASDRSRAQSAEAFWRAGDIRRWGAASWLRGWVRCARGDFRGALQECMAVARVAEEAADHQAWGWALQGAGRALWRLGSHDEASVCLTRAAELLEAVPDYQMLTCARGDLGACFLRQGRLEEAREMLEETRGMIAAHDFRGFLVTQAHRGLAEAYLGQAERSPRAARRPPLLRFRRQCRVMLRQSRLDSEARAPAYRLQGTCEWMEGRPGPARRWWDRSLASAEHMGARFETGLTWLEIGKRTRDLLALDRAEEVFADLHAAWDLRQVHMCRDGVATIHAGEPE